MEVVGITSALTWWRRAGWGQRSIALLGIAGFACIGLSLLPEPGLDDSWVRDVLMTIGSSLALFAPFYLLTRSLDRHLNRVAAETARQVDEVRTDTAQQVEEIRSDAAARKSELAGELEALRADVDRNLATLQNE